MTGTTLDCADAYIGRGWPVFVLSRDKAPVANCRDCRTTCQTPDEKEACPHLTCHGFYSATLDPDRIREMLRRTPNGCLAVRTGAPSGIVVIDIDPPTGNRTLVKLDEENVLPGTITTMTGRELGLHFYYAHPGERIPSKTGALGPGVDVKGDGGYAIVPPSLHPKSGRRYMWGGNGRFDYPLTPLHPALVDRLRPHQTASSLDTDDARTAFWGEFRNTGKSPHHRLRGLVDTVLAAPPHEGNSVLHWCACRAGDMVAAGEIDRTSAETALQLAAEHRGRPTAEARATIASGFGRAS